MHEFARDVIRPAAAEWDEREETPWPILEEAAKIGLYSLDFFSTQWFDPSGLGTVVAFEELFWGDAGIGLSLVGSGLAAIAVASNGTNEQIGEWLPQMFGSPGDVKLGAFCSSEPDAGSDVGAIRTRAGLRRGHRRMGASTARRPGRPTAASRTSTSSWRRSIPRSAVAARPPSSCRRARRACRRARSSASTASGRRTRPRSSWTTCGFPAGAWSAGRNAWTRGWPGSPAGGAAASRRR